MRERKAPFRFDFTELLSVARRKLGGRVGGVTINLPFISVSVDPDDAERQAAREIVIQLADRRVLNAWECCDNCIDHAIESLQEIRKTLVDKQVQLSAATDGPLYLLIELMLGGIRQFMTFTERLDQQSESSLILPTDVRRPRETRETYFDALESLRAHLYRCLAQVAVIAAIDIPRISEPMRYDSVWQVEAYVMPRLGVENPPSVG